MKADTTTRIVSDAEHKQWNTIASHPLQSFEWGQFRRAMGTDVVRIGLYRKNTLISGWQMTFHTIPFTRYTIGYLPKGPTLSEEMVASLIDIGKKKHAIFIQLEPDLPFNDATHHEYLHHFFLSRSPRPLFTQYTFEIDCQQNEETLFTSFHSKTRYNIKLAKRHGVHIEEQSTEKGFEIFERLSDETTKRQGFYAHNHRYHRTLWNILNPSGIAKIFTASYNGNVVAAWMIFIWKSAMYYPYGASSREHREVMAPNLLLWELTLWAKKHAIKTFDLWGALGPNPDPKDPWYGFHKFKLGYAPKLIEFIGSYDLVLHPSFYRIFILLNSLRWTILSFRKKIAI